MEFTLEICIDSIESAVNAQTAGANRVELCGNLLEGGTTPGWGTIVSVRNNLDIGLNVIIRPRGSDFLYSDPELTVCAGILRFAVKQVPMELFWEFSSPTEILTSNELPI